MIKTIGQGKTPTIVTKGPNFKSPSEKVSGISINLLLISSAVIALVTNNPTRNTNSHCLRWFHFEFSCVFSKIQVFIEWSNIGQRSKDKILNTIIYLHHNPAVLL